MKPIVGEINYKDLTREGLDLYISEAEVLRAEAMRAAFSSVFKGIAAVFNSLKSDSTDIDHGYTRPGGAL